MSSIGNGIGQRRPTTLMRTPSSASSTEARNAHPHTVAEHKHSEVAA